MRTLARAAAVVLLVLFSGCGLGSSPPTPTPRPATPTAAPRATPAPTLDASTSDVQDAFLSTLNDLTSDVETLANAQCPDLVAETSANPTELADMRNFAATLQRVASSQSALDSDDVRSSLSDLSKAMSQLEAELATCGIKTP